MTLECNPLRNNDIQYHFRYHPNKLTQHSEHKIIAFISYDMTMTYFGNALY